MDVGVCAEHRVEVAKVSSVTHADRRNQWAPPNRVVIAAVCGHCRWLVLTRA